MVPSGAFSARIGAMNQEKWSEVDHYVTNVLGLTDEALESALRESDGAGLPAIAVSIPQGKFLNQLAQILNARRILEI